MEITCREIAARATTKANMRICEMGLGSFWGYSSGKSGGIYSFGGSMMAS